MNRLFRDRRIAIVLCLVLVILMCGCSRKPKEKTLGIAEYYCVSEAMDVLDISSTMEDGALKLIIAVSEDEGYAIWEWDSLSYQLSKLFAYNQEILFTARNSAGIWVVSFEEGYVLTLLSDTGEPMDIVNLADSMAEVSDDEIVSIECLADGSIALIGNYNTVFFYRNRQIDTLQYGGLLCATGRSEDGSLVMACGSEDTAIYEMDRNNDEFVYIETPQESCWGVNVIYIRDEIYYMNSQGLYQIDKKSERQLISWVELGVDSSFLYDLRLGNDNQFYVVRNERTQNTTKIEVYVLKYGVNGESREPIELAIGDILDNALKDAILQFNRENEEYYIKIVNYQGYGDSRDDVLRNFNIAISQGYYPDLIVVNDFNYQAEIEKGILMDLYPLYANDERIDRKDIFENVIDALSIQSKLYAIPLNFSVDTLWVPASLMEEDLWSLSDAMRMSKEWPNKKLYQQGIHKIFLDLYNCNEDEFLDIGRDYCQYDENFIALIEYCKMQQGTITEYPWNVSEEQIAVQGSITPYIRQMVQQMFGEEVKSVGYPGINESVYPILFSSNLLGICEYSDKKELAWEFIEYAIAGTQMEQYLSDIPLNKSKYVEFWSSEEERFSIEGYGHATMNDWEYFYTAPTEEEIEYCIELIEKANKAFILDYDIWNILDEEISGVLGGDESAEAAANRIQNRVKIIMEERK